MATRTRLTGMSTDECRSLVACDYCGAPIGEYCLRGEDLTLTRGVHITRWKAYQEAKK